MPQIGVVRAVDSLGDMMKDAGGGITTVVVPPPPIFKFDEDKYVTEVMDYIATTYSKHYVGDGIQAIDLIFAGGHGEGFCLGNINKYAARYGKKEGYNRKDLQKIVHYALLLLYLHTKHHS